MRVKSFLFSIMALSFMGCTASVSGGPDPATVIGGQGSGNGNPAPKPGSPDSPANAPGCPFAVVPAPKALETLVPEGIFKSVAYTTPSCKTVAIAVSKEKHEIVVARFLNTTLDKSFGTNGSSRFTFLEDQWAVDATVKVADQRVLMIGSAGNGESLGLYLAQFDREGKFQSEAYTKGTAWSRVWGRPANGSSCHYNYLEVKSLAVVGTQVTVHADYSNPCSTGVTPIERKFNLVKPALTHLHAPVPATCQNYNYNSPGAVNSEVYKLKQVGCSSLTLDYEYLSWGSGGSSDHFTASTDGQCLDTLMYGRSCFTYENGYLTRTFVDSSWQLAKSYYAVVKSDGYLCGYSGTTGTYLVVSAYPPTDPKFSENCMFH